VDNDKTNDLTRHRERRTFIAQQRALLRAATDARVLAMGVLMERYGLTKTKAALLLAKIATRAAVPVEAIAARVLESVTPRQV
jgi:hypothetical protein